MAIYISVISVRIVYCRWRLWTRANEGTRAHVRFPNMNTTCVTRVCIGMSSIRLYVCPGVLSR